MRRNRAIRNQIEARYGVSLIEELERWNDRVLDSLEESGIELSAEEEVAQAQVLATLSGGQDG